MCITLWGDIDQNISGDVGDVLFIVNTKITDYKSGKKLSIGLSSKIEVNPIWETTLKNWFIKNNTNEIINIFRTLFSLQETIAGNYLLSVTNCFTGYVNI